MTQQSVLVAYESNGGSQMLTNSRIRLLAAAWILFQAILLVDVALRVFTTQG